MLRIHVLPSNIDFYTRRGSLDLCAIRRSRTNVGLCDDDDDLRTDPAQTCSREMNNAER